MQGVFGQIKGRVNKQPENIEQLVELQEYMNTQMQQDVKEVQRQLGQYQQILEILDDMQERLQPEDIKNYWLCYSIPKEVQEKKKQIRNELEVLKETFYEDMQKDQSRFLEEVVILKAQVQNFILHYSLENYQGIFAESKEIQAVLREVVDKATVNKQRETLFNKKAHDYSSVFSLEQHFSHFSNFWRIVHYWRTQRENWMNGDWATVDAPEAERFVQEGIEDLGKIKVYLQGKNKGQFDELLKNLELIKGELVQFKAKVPLLVALKARGIKQRHWQELSKKTGLDLDPEKIPGFSFQKLLDLGMMKHKEHCLEIGAKANKEFAIEENLSRMKQKWEGLVFKTIPFKQSTFFLVSNFDELDQELDEDFGMTETMIVNPFKGPFEQEIDEWNQKLLGVSNILEEWRRMQHQWSYLQPIFSSKDISHQLKKEYSMFKLSDSFYQTLLKSVHSLKQVLLVCDQEELLEKLKTANLDFDNIQIQLKSYLAIKRSKFARFYFLSDDDLLSILSETKEVERIQGHLRKVFENIQKLEFDPKKTIMAMYSVEGERIPFVEPINPLNKQVEDWMSLVEQQMKSSVRKALLESVEDYKQRSREEWIFSHPGQCVLNGSQVHWTQEVEEAI